MIDGAGGTRDNVANLRGSNVRALHATVAIARASSAEATAGWVSARDTLDGDEKSSSVLIDNATSVRAADVAHEGRHRSKTTIIT